MQNILLIKFNHGDAQLPVRSTKESAGYDLHTIEDGNIEPGQTKLFDTGLSFTVPEGTYGRIAPRSGLSKKGLLVNAGVIDRDYTGPVKIMLHNLSGDTYVVNKDDRIAQLILEKIETSKMILLDSLEDTERGSGGFGSTGV